MFTNYYFTGELGKELLYIYQYSLMQKLPTIGMATSHEWLSYGPIYYWIMIPIFNIFNGNPHILLWVALFTGALGLFLNYFIIKKIINQKVAIISTLLQLISPLLVWQTSLAKLHTFFFVLSPILMYLMYLIWNKNSKYIFWTGLVFGIMFSFHFSQIPMILVILGILFIKKYNLKSYLILFLGILIPNFGIIINDLKIFLWLPYRVVEYSTKNYTGTLGLVNEYFGRNLFWDSRFWIIGTLIFVVIFSKYIKKNMNNLRNDFTSYYLISMILVMLIANILHGTPPIHYFLPIFTTVPVLFASYLEKNKYAYLFVLILVLINFNGYLKPKLGNDYVPFSKQIAITDFIVGNANGQPFSIKRIGPYDYFPDQYSQNYKYLILWRGGNLVEGSVNTYTINDNNGTITK